MPSEDVSVERLRELVIEVLERLDGGPAQESEAEAVIEEACRAHPDLAEGLRARITALRSLGLIEAQASDLGAPSSIGDFDLLERVGSGGMGVVYRARQRSLGRDVALKLIRPDALHVPGARERFARETSIVARLQHPGIVPIHTVGGEDEVPYYAMELVPGCTLAEALARLTDALPGSLTGADLQRAVCEHCGRTGPVPDGGFFEGTWEQVSLRLVRHVADALEHAHGRGVLHRDLKPSNVMLTPEGRVLLVDFGLSRADGGDGMTRTTDQVGSLPYMSPELLRDGVRALDPRSDVYALGVTLYELLTLRLPYAAASAPATMMRIVEGRPVRPRSHHPGLSWEAETVCLAAMDRDPRRRYASAADLASDLTNALERRPLEARRASALLRLRRWVAHRPGLAAAILLAVALPSVAALLLEREARRVRTALDRATVQEARALSNRDRALEAIDSMLLELDREGFYDVPGMDEVRLSILSKAESLCAELMREAPDDPAPALLAGRCDESRAGIASHAERREEAERLLRGAIERVEPWLDPTPENYDLRYSVARWRSSRAVQLLFLDRAEEAAELDLEAIAAYHALLEERPEREDVQVALLLRLSERVARGRASGVHEGGEQALVRLVEMGRDLARRSHADRTPALLALLLETLCAWRDREGREHEALELARESLALRERVAEADPGDRINRYYVTAALSNLAGRLMGVGQDEEALPLMERCVDQADALLDDFPDSSDHRFAVADAYLNYGAVLGRLGRDEESRGAYDRALFALDELLALRPTDAELHRTLGTTLLNLSATEVDMGAPDAALATCAAALAAFSEAARLAPESGDVGSWLALERKSRADVLLALGDPATAAEALIETPELARHRGDRLRGCLARLEECLARARAEGDSATIERCEEAVRLTLRGVARRGDMQGVEVVRRLELALEVE